MEYILLGKTIISNSKQSKELIKNFNKKEYEKKAINGLKDLLENTTGGKIISSAISKYRNQENSNVLEYNKSGNTQEFKINNKNSIWNKIIENEQAGVGKVVQGTKWFTDKLVQGKNAINGKIRDNLLNDAKKLKDFAHEKGNNFENKIDKENNKVKVDNKTSTISKKNNNTSNAGTKSVNYNYKEEVSSIKSNTGNRGTSGTTVKDTNSNNNVKGELKKEILNVDDGIFGYEQTLEGFTNKEQKELKSYIDELVGKFGEKIPKGEKQRDNLMQKFENYLYFTVNNIKDDTKTSNKNRINYIKSELDKKANNFFEEDISSIKKDLEDSAYERIKKNSMNIFNSAKKQVEGNLENSNINIKQENKELKELLDNVKDYNRDSAEYLIEETRKDLKYINNKNNKTNSLRLNQYMENRSIEEGI